MADNKVYPYSDEYMIFDENSRKYYITPAQLDRMAVNLRAELSAVNTADAAIYINFAIERATDMVYGFIHDYNADNVYQDYLISNVPSIRPIIQHAISMQAVYNYMNGDGDFSADKNVRETKYYGGLYRDLSKIIPELGRSILYTGKWRC